MFMLILKKYCRMSIFFTLPLLLASCAKKINISHASFANKKAIPRGFPLGTSFAIKSLKKKNGMIEQDLTNKIELILQNKGYTVQNKSQAHYYLIFDYRIQETKKTEDIITFIPGKVVNSYRTIIRKGKTKLYQESLETPGKFVTVPEVHILFNKSLVIQIFKAEAYQQEDTSPLIWQGSAQYCDDNDDLRDTLNYLLIISLRDFGIDTQRNIETAIDSNDKEVLNLKEQYVFDKI